MGKTIGAILSLTNNFSPEIKKVAKDLNMTVSDMKKAAKSVKTFQKQCSDAASKLKTGLISSIAATAATSAVLVNKTMEAGDRIDKMSQKVGMSRKAFQELDYVFSQSGIQMDSFTTGAKKLSEAVFNVNKKNSESAQIFKTLGVRVKNNKGQFLSQEVILKKTLAALQKMPQSVNKAVYAQKLFGKQGMQLMPLLNSQTKGVDELIEKCHSLGMVLSNEEVDAAVKLTDTIDTMKRSFAPLGYMFANMLIPRIQTFSDYVIANMPKIKSVTQNTVKNLSDFISNLAKNMEKLTLIAVPLVAVIVSFKVFSGVFTVLQTLNGIIKTCTTMQILWNAALLANPIGLIAGGLALLAGGLVFAYQKFEGFRSMVNACFDILKLLGNSISFVWQKLNQVLSPVADFTLKVIKLIAPLYKLVELINNGAQALGGWRGIGKSISGLANDANAKINAEKAKIPKNALGTNYFSGGLTSINEGGRDEIVELPTGTRIIPHNVAKQSASQKQDIKVEVTVQGNVIGNNEFLEQMAVRFTKELQLALAVV